VLWGGLIRIPHSKVNYIFTPCARSRFQLIYDIEDVGWKTFYPGEIVNQWVKPVKCREFSALAKDANITDNLKGLSISQMDR